MSVLHRTATYTMRHEDRPLGGGHVRFLCVDIDATPSVEDMTHIMSMVVVAAQHAAQRFVLLFQQAPVHMALPGVEALRVVASTLLAHRELVRAKLLCSVFQCRHMDTLARTCRDLFLTLYRPARPLCFTDSPAEAAAFLAAHASG